MPLPNFLVIGAQKAGTSWLVFNLRQHPDVFMPPYEVHYFDKDYNFKKGLSWYKQHFDAVEDQKAIGEKTPDYLWANGRGVEGHLPTVHHNIYNTLPWVRLIVILRNPVERAISAVNHIIRSGRISPLHNIDDLLIGAKRHLIEGHGVFDYGRYYRQLKAYYELFHPEQILILIFEEDVVKSPSTGLRKVCDFLGIESTYQFQYREDQKHAGGSSKATLVMSYYLPFLRPLARLMRRYLPASKLRPSELAICKLYDLYTEENEKLFELMGYRPLLW